MGEDEEAVFPGDMSEENPSLKRDRLCIEEEEEEVYSNKKQAKEASNDDVRSEISNPVASPVDITSRSSSDRVGSCSGSDSGSTETTSGGATSSFVLEIPKHLSTTGITKITFKLSKPLKEEAFCDLPMTQVRTWEGASSNVASSKKVSDFLPNVKKLLLTSILDGARVKYISNSPLRELDGIIYSGGYLCGCAACNFTKVLGGYEFEKHAGRKTKHPNIHIFLENGRSVYNVVQELKTVHVGALEEVIRKVAGSALNEEGFQVWKDTISRKYREKGIYTDNGDTVEWMMLSGKSRCPEHEHLLPPTSTIFRECFDPIVAKSGRDLIPVMVYGRNISGQEFGGMYCLVLMVNSLVVSAALLRIFGQKVAELPMVATSREYQGRGYFQLLFACIENLLSSLSVENLLLPAAQEAESIWTKKFGFTKMTEQQLQKYQREVQLTIFQGTSMLEKKVPIFSESSSAI